MKTGLFKRLIPFFLTFALGLLVASFFVSIAAPNFQFKRKKCRREHQSLRWENEQLKQRINELETRQMQEEMKFNPHLTEAVPPPPPLPPAPPRVRKIPFRKNFQTTD